LPTRLFKNVPNGACWYIFFRVRDDYNFPIFMLIFVMAALCIHMFEATVFEQFYYLFTVHGVFIHTIRTNINKKNKNPESKMKEAILNTNRSCEGVILKKFFYFIPVGKHTDYLVYGNSCPFDFGGLFLIICLNLKKRLFITCRTMNKKI